MKRARKLIALAMALAALGLVACGGDDGEEASTSPAPSEAPAPSGSATPPAPSGGAAPSHVALPPEFVECMTQQGYEVASYPDLASVPQEAVQACAGSMH